MTQWPYVYRQWLQRELQLRFRSSALGTGWLVLQPLAQILLFTLVFYQFFQVRWPAGDGSVGEYGLQVFIGLGLYGFCAEVINRSPGSISAHPYLVTKVRFALLLLPAVVVGAAAVQLLLSLAIAAAFAFWRAPHWQALLLPLALLPLLLYGQALAWLRHGEDGSARPRRHRFGNAIRLHSQDLFRRVCDGRLSGRAHGQLHRERGACDDEERDRPPRGVWKGSASALCHPPDRCRRRGGCDCDVRERGA